MTTREKEHLLSMKYPDLYICHTNYNRAGGTWQVCDGCGRDGFVMASSTKSREDAIAKAYKERVEGNA